MARPATAPITSAEGTRPTPSSGTTAAGWLNVIGIAGKATVSGVENAAIADRLDAFAALLDLAEANPYQPRAYRRAAETVRTSPIAVAELVRTSGCASCGGSGRGSRRGCVSS